MVNVLRPDELRPALDRDLSRAPRRTVSSVSRRSWGRSRERSRSLPGVRSGERSAVDVIDEHLARIDARDGEINAFNLVTADAAREAAAAIDAAVASGKDPGPLAGVPIAIKDNMCTTGVAQRARRNPRGMEPPYDATVVQRVVAAGAVMVGKTNLDEFDGFVHRELGVRSTKNPLSDSSRVVRVAVPVQQSPLARPAVAGFRYRRFDPPASRVLRPRRHEADVRRCEPLRPGRVRFVA